MHKFKATYFAGYAFQRFPFEMPVSDNEKKKNPQSCSSTKWAKPPHLPLACSRQAVLVSGAESARRSGGAARTLRACTVAQLRSARLGSSLRPHAPPGSASGPPPLTAGSSLRSQLDFATVSGRKGAQAFARLP